ncbi:senescence-associated protein-domain-containing protein [Geranomyces variabilis]|nr:senescence-associated protein-domain-containing protein [Geranomyces variabilis]KAJ3143578.1 hypothetical protein HDU90_000341 [Geranomyces variabilis]
MSALSFPHATITIVPKFGSAPAPLGSGKLTIAQEPSGSVSLQGKDWTLSLPPTTRAKRTAVTSYLISLPPTARLSRTAGGAGKDFTFDDGADADLRLDFDKADANSLAIFDTLFETEGYDGAASDAAPPPAYPNRVGKDLSHANSLAVVDEQGDVVGVVAEGVELDHEEAAPPTYESDTDSVVIELSSLPVVNLGPQQQDLDDKEREAVAVRVKVIRDASTGVLLTSEYVSTGLVVGSSVLGKAVKTGAASLKTLIPVAAKPWQPTPGTKQNIDKFVKGAATTADMTRRAAETVASVATTAGQKVAAKLIPASATESHTGHASWELLKNTVHAVSNVLDAVTDAGKSLYKDSVDAGGELVGHRYGPEAQLAFRSSLGAAGNVALIYFDAKGVGRRAFLKHAAKGAVTNVRLKDGRIVSLGKGEDLKKSGIWDAARAGLSSISGSAGVGSRSSSSYVGAVPPPRPAAGTLKK